MESCYYRLRRVPDFTLSKYASLSETGPDGVLTQHGAFWRQMNQWSQLFSGLIHFICQFEPERAPGERMSILLRFDAPESHAIDCLKHLMAASVLSPYYDTLELTDAGCLSDCCYSWQVNLLKTERTIASSDHGEEAYYTVSEWKMNQGARLYSMLRLMAVSALPCAYCVDLQAVRYAETMQQRLTYLFTRLRSRKALKVKTGTASVSTGGRDEGAKKALDYYEDLLEALAASPHFLVNVQVFGNAEAESRQILDAAASEALSEGSHELYSQRYGAPLHHALDQGFVSWCSPDTPESLQVLPHLFLLEEMRPFATLPVLFPGESIELPKETVPPAERGMFIGWDEQEHPIYFPWQNLPKHAFLAGMPGSGKTNAMMYLVNSIRRAGVGVLVLEPAKREYRSLTVQPEERGLSLFSPGANSLFPIHINPFEFPEGMKMADHMNRLLKVFYGTFELDPPMPMLLAEGIQMCYEELLWLPGMVNTGELEYPTMTMLYQKVEALLDRYQYAAEVRSNMQSILQVRIGSLLSREMGDVFDVPRSSLAPQEWLKRSAVIELASLGTAPTNFMILMLMTLVRESLDVEPYVPDEKNPMPRHVIFLEEAHNLIAQTSVQMPGKVDPKISATALIKDMLAEVRALGEGMVIADQLPTAMAPEVVKNTSLKIGLRLTSQDERAVLGGTMSADEVQMERMGIFSQGRCLIGYEGLMKPFELQLPKAKGDNNFNDEQILRALVTDQTYHRNMMASAEIMVSKFRVSLSHLKTRRTEVEKAVERWIRRLRQAADGKEQVPGMKEERESLTKQCEGYLRDLHRMSLDCLLFLDTIVSRERALRGLGLPPEETRESALAQKNWRGKVYKEFYRAELLPELESFAQYCSRRNLKLSPELENRYQRQKQIITARWKQGTGA